MSRAEGKLICCSFQHVNIFLTLNPSICAYGNEENVSVSNLIPPSKRINYIKTNKKAMGSNDQMKGTTARRELES